MVKSLVSSNKASVNGNRNNVWQNSSVENVLIASGSDMIDILGSMKNYDAIQKIISDYNRRAEVQHPLFPEFKAKYNSELGKLISIPETKEALERYPRHIKGAVKINFKDYPYMNENETLEEYIYRTQTKLELETTAYKEYLGDEPDPYPRIEYSEGMTTTINPPEFPEAIEASIVSKDISIPVMIRRLPCMEYGKMIIGTVSEWQGFDLSVLIEGDFVKEVKSSRVNMTKKAGKDLSALLLRERLLKSVAESKKMKIVVNNVDLMSGVFSEDELNQDIFKYAPMFCNYIENLIRIEEHLGHCFNPDIREILIDDYHIASVIVASLEGKWLVSKEDFDNGVRCSYTQIPKELTDGQDKNEIGMDMTEVTFSLQGVPFGADKLIIVYTDAKVNNVESIKKNVKRKRKDILVTVKPKDGKDKLRKYVKMEGIRMDK